jgi:hypothetical protein
LLPGLIGSKEASSNQVVNVMVSNYAFIRQGYPQISLSVRTVLQVLVGVHVHHTPKITDRVVWITLQFHPNFLYVQKTPYLNKKEV